MKFYTNFLRYGNRIFIRGYSNGKPFNDKVEYNPILYFPTKEKTEFKTLNGEFVKPVPQGNIKSALNVVKNYNEIENYQVYGSTNFPYVYINDTYSGKINYDVSQIKVANIDIEVASENGFPHVAFASEEIISITIKLKGVFYVFGCNGSGVALMPYLGYKSISLITKKTNSPIIITKINNKKNYFKKIISFLLPIVGIYYRKKEDIENKFF